MGKREWVKGGGGEYKKKKKKNEKKEEAMFPNKKQNLVFCVGVPFSNKKQSPKATGPVASSFQGKPRTKLEVFVDEGTFQKSQKPEISML